MVGNGASRFFFSFRIDNGFGPWKKWSASFSVRPKFLFHFCLWIMKKNYGLFFHHTGPRWTPRGRKMSTETKKYYIFRIYNEIIDNIFLYQKGSKSFILFLKSVITSNHEKVVCLYHTASGGLRRVGNAISRLIFFFIFTIYNGLRSWKQ